MNKEEIKNIQKKIDNNISDDYDNYDKNAYENNYKDLTENEIKEIRRLEFSSKIKRVLAQRVGYHCSFPDCSNVTIGPGDSDNNVVVLGEAAHIIGAINTNLSPRKDPSKSPRDIINLENGIWLCRNHHKLIDSRENKYTADMLRKYKKDAEDKQTKRMENNMSETLEDFIYPSIDVDKGINSSSFKECQWCLLAFLFEKFYNKGETTFEFSSDAEGNSFDSEYREWMSSNDININTSKLFSPYQNQLDNLNNVVEKLVGLVIINNSYISIGDKFEDFMNKLTETDEELMDKIVKKLSINK